MSMITEQDIDVILDRYDANPEIYQDYRKELVDAYLPLTALLTADNMSILDDNEYDILWFVCTTIYATVKSKERLVEDLNPTQIEQAEEANWELMTEKKDFRERVTPLFDSYDQEDLLAFVEDTIISDEEEGDLEVSETAKDVIFVTAKTMIDTVIA